ncbi:MAG TPA: hypothetical protein VJ965_08915 [Anaerolineales bacterium]|nr:hypothetical protein [Anaerolineales bacterium]
MNIDYRPSIVRIISTHYLTFIAVITPLILWSFFLFDYLQGDVLTGNNILVLGGFAFLGLLITLWNVTSIVSIINHGQKTTAVIHSVGFYRGRGTIQFVYTFQGERYMGKNTVMKNKRTGSLKPGNKVEIFLSHDNPKKSVIGFIYAN